MPTIKEIKLLAKDKNILIPKKIRKKSDMILLILKLLQLLVL